MRLRCDVRCKETESEIRLPRLPLYLVNVCYLMAKRRKRILQSPFSIQLPVACGTNYIFYYVWIHGLMFRDYFMSYVRLRCSPWFSILIALFGELEAEMKLISGVISSWDSDSEVSVTNMTLLYLNPSILTPF